MRSAGASVFCNQADDEKKRYETPKYLGWQDTPRITATAGAQLLLSRSLASVKS